MTITTSRGKTFESAWADTVRTTGELMIEIADDGRLLSAIALDFEGLDAVTRTADGQAEIQYDGYSSLAGMTRDAVSRSVLITLRKE